MLKKELVDEFLSVANSLLDHKDSDVTEFLPQNEQREGFKQRPMQYEIQQSFPSESEARNFANWIKGTSDGSEVSVFRNDAEEWVVKSTERSYLEDDPSGWSK